MIYLLQHGIELWHFELHFNPPLRQLQRREVHLEMQLHFKNPCPPTTEDFVATSLNESETDGTSSTDKKISGQTEN